MTEDERNREAHKHVAALIIAGAPIATHGMVAPGYACAVDGRVYFHNVHDRDAYLSALMEQVYAADQAV